MNDHRYKSLQILTRARIHIISDLNREEQRYASYLAAGSSDEFQDGDAAAAASRAALMRAFETPEQLACADPEALKGAVVENCQTGEKIHGSSARDASKADANLALAMAGAEAVMRALREQCDILNAAIIRQMETVPTTLTSIPGVGKVCAAGIIAEIGDIDRFDSQDAIARYAGLSPVYGRTGDGKGAGKGNRYLHHYLMEAAEAVRKSDPEFYRYYERKYAESGPNCSKKRVLEATARKLVRLIFCLLRENQPYLCCDGPQKRGEASPTCESTNSAGRRESPQRRVIVKEKYTTEQLVGRWEDHREIKNVMGKYAVSFLLKREHEIFDQYWAHTDDVCLGLNDGWYVGAEAIQGYYAACVRHNELVRDILTEHFPEQTAGKTKEELYGIGQLDELSICNCVIEIAADGQTAKGMWYVFGKPVTVTERGPVSQWIFGTYCADFLREESGWKLWHLMYLKDIDSPCGVDWSKNENPYPELCEFAPLKELKLPQPTVPVTLRELYTVNRPFTKLPPVPEPYDTFAETFSYGL